MVHEGANYQFVLWSMLTSLGLVIWYFPLWNMGISGYEASLLCTLSPFFLGIPIIRKLVTCNIAIVQMLSLVGIASYWLKDPANRLLAIAFGNAMSLLSFAASVCSDRFDNGQMSAAAFGLGLIASSVAKMAFWTNNPIWPIMHAENGGWNNAGLLVGLCACIIKLLVPNRELRVEVSVGKDATFLVACGLAGLFFAQHSLLSDSSTLILWVWDGYPVTGPQAVPHGAWTICVMGAGLLVGFSYRSLARVWAWYASGFAGAFLFTVCSGWIGYYGGLCFAFYVMSLVPSFLEVASRLPPGRVFGFAFLLYNLMVLAHVWVVAYAFVPGGPLLRERSELLMLFTMLLLGAGVTNLSRTPTYERSKLGISTHRVLKRPRQRWLFSVLTVAGLSGLAIAIAYVRFPSYAYEPYHPEIKMMTAGVWTVHFGIDNGLWASEYRISDLLREMELDVVGLIETDLQRIIMGNRDLTQFLAEDLGMHSDYGPGPNKHTWGVALLSKFPILNSTHHMLPSPVGELAPAIHATLDVYGQEVDVIVFHSGQEEDPEDRRLQSLEISRMMEQSPRPLVLLSYLVVKPQEGNYNTYVSATNRMRDIDPSDWDRWCEYILYRGMRRTGYARVSRDTITDTELQVGKFIVQEGGVEEHDERVEEDQVPQAMQFPAQFRGEGVRGHRYHVFDGPRYFA